MLLAHKKIRFQAGNFWRSFTSSMVPWSILTQFSQMSKFKIIIREEINQDYLQPKQEKYLEQRRSCDHASLWAPLGIIGRPYPQNSLRFYTNGLSEVDIKSQQLEHNKVDIKS